MTTLALALVGGSTASAAPLELAQSDPGITAVGTTLDSLVGGRQADDGTARPPVASAPAASATPAPTDSGLIASTGGERARLANVFSSSLGVNVKTSNNTGAWGQHAKIETELQRLGARHLRTRLYTNRSAQYAVLRSLAAAGVRSDVIAGDPTGVGGTPEQLVSTAASQLGSAVESFEGVNEWNFSGHSNWAAEARAHQQRLFKAVNASSRTSSIPVLGPAISANSTDQRSVLGDLSAYLDYGNNHLYPGGRVPSYRIDQQIDSARIICGNKPVLFTEMGYHNALRDTSTHWPTSESVAAIYGPRLLAEHFARGENRMYLYDLVDDAANSLLNNREDHFGLLRNDLSEKPVFGALRNLLQVTADPGASFTPGSLNYSLAGAPSDLRHILLQKSNGKFLLLLWRDVAVWDPVKKVNLAVGAATIGVRLPSTTAVSVFRPSASTSAQATMMTSAPSVRMGGDLVVLQIG